MLVHLCTLPPTNVNTRRGSVHAFFLQITFQSTVKFNLVHTTTSHPIHPPHKTRSYNTFPLHIVSIMAIILPTFPATLLLPQQAVHIHLVMLLLLLPLRVHPLPRRTLHNQNLNHALAMVHPLTKPQPLPRPDPQRCNHLGPPVCQRLVRVRVVLPPHPVQLPLLILEQDFSRLYAVPHHTPELAPGRIEPLFS